MENNDAIRRMTEEEYRAYPAVNKSTLWEMRKSPAHYKYALEHPTADTPALKLGRAIHMAILQPDEFERHYVVAPNIDRRTKAGKEQYDLFMAQLGDRELIDIDTFNELTEMYAAVWNDPNAKELLTGCEFETPLFWVDESTGIECKCRLDAYKIEGRKATIIDLKTCADARTDVFTRKACVYGYDVQSAFYIRGFKANFDVDTVDWWFIAVEKSKPYAVNSINAGNLVDRGGYLLIDKDPLGKIKECRESNCWPAYGKTTISLPDYLLMPYGGDEDE